MIRNPYTATLRKTTAQYARNEKNKENINWVNKFAVKSVQIR